MVPAKKTRKKRTLGFLAGKLLVPEDFDAPLPEDVIAEAATGLGMRAP